VVNGLKTSYVRVRMRGGSDAEKWEIMVCGCITVLVGAVIVLEFLINW